jgi:hypothetical protein
MWLIRLGLIDTGKPIAEIVADEVTGGGGQVNVGKWFRFTCERGRRADNQPTDEKQRATVSAWIPGWLRYAGNVFIKASRKNLFQAGARYSESTHSRPLYFQKYNASFFPQTRQRDHILTTNEHVTEERLPLIPALSQR